jgi:hypothetical protein
MFRLYRCRRLGTICGWTFATAGWAGNARNARVTHDAVRTIGRWGGGADSGVQAFMSRPTQPAGCPVQPNAPSRSRLPRKTGVERARYGHHVLLCAFGGFVLGGAQATLAAPTRGPDLTLLVMGWIVLGLLHGPLTWPMLARRAWWCTTLAVCVALAIAAGCVAWFDQTALVLAGPLAGWWLTVLACRRLLPAIQADGLCRVCDYDLRGLPLPRCPECGTGFDRCPAPLPLPEP